MNMIGHDHVAPNSNIKFALRAMSVLLKSKLGAVHRGNTSAVASRKSNEVEWLIDVNQIKSMRTVLDHSSNCRGSRVGCNNLDSAGARLPSHRLVWLGAPQARQNQPYPPPLKPAEPNNTEQPACDGRRLENKCCCVEPDIIDNGHEIIA